MSGISATGFVVEMKRGPFQSNGATPWYCIMGVGTPPQPLYFCFDTGSNFNWVTSSLCGSDGCKHFADHQFNINDSSSFKLINAKEQTVNFGPWGQMDAKLGTDLLTLGQTDQLELRSNILLSCSYNSEAFEELDWDGGIGLGSSQKSTNINKHLKSNPFRFFQSQATNSDDEFDFFLQLMECGIVSKDMPYMSFICADKQGFVGFGMLDKSYSTSLEYAFLPWNCYQPEASYLWSTANASIGISGEQPIGTDLFFALDSGSSQFKGDEKILNQMFKVTNASHSPVVITLDDEQGQPYTKLIVPSELYMCEIEAGQNKGQVVSQFKGLEGADGMLLVGSVLMDHLYTVYEYKVDDNQNLSPVGVWIFNKPDGPKIIANKQSVPAELFNR